jgi:hypothetical protein
MGRIIAPDGSDARVSVYGSAPTPNESVEARVNVELQTHLDALLFIRWVPMAVWNAPAGRGEGRYALMCRWPSADLRWQWVQDGRHDPNEACDMLGWFCEDMSNANSVPVQPDAMLERVRILLGKCDNTRFPWAERMKQCVEHNAAQRAKLKKDALDNEAHEAAHDAYYKSSLAARSFGGLDKTQSKEAENG